MSSGGAAVAAVRSEGLAASTAMVLLPTGELREYPRPATVAQALQDSVEAGDGSAGWFLCDADRMGFAGSVAAMAAGAERGRGRARRGEEAAPKEARYASTGYAF